MIVEIEERWDRREGVEEIVGSRETEDGSWEGGGTGWKGVGKRGWRRGP